MQSVSEIFATENSDTLKFEFWIGQGHWWTNDGGTNKFRWYDFLFRN